MLLFRFLAPALVFLASSNAVALYATANTPNLDLFPSWNSLRQHRLQQDTDGRACNEEIGMFSREELVFVMRLFYSFLLGASNTELIDSNLQGLESQMRYDTKVYKICSSCLDLSEEQLSGTDVCDENKYGSNATHSSLVFVPMYSSKEIVSGTLRSILYYRGTVIDVSSAGTELWPREPATVETGDMLLAYGYFETAFAASKGGVGIAPDMLGYGESLSTHNRPYLIKESYGQAAAVAFRGVQDWISQTTNGCTTLSNTLTVSGDSEGGYAAAASIFTYQDMEIDILNAFVNAPVLDVDMFFAFVVESYDLGAVGPIRDNFYLWTDAALLPFAYSIELPGLANTGTDQTGLHPEWMNPDDFNRNVVAWLKSPDPVSGEEWFQLMPMDYPLKIVNENLLILAREANALNLTNPCQSEAVDATTELLCEAILSNGIVKDWSNITSNTTLCFSPQDSIIPSYQFTTDLFAHENVVDGSTFLGNPLEGDHIQAVYRCAYNVFEFLSTNEEATLVLQRQVSDGSACPSPTTATPGPSPMDSQSATWSPSTTTVSWVLAVSMSTVLFG